MFWRVALTSKDLPTTHLTILGSRTSLVNHGVVWRKPVIRGPGACRGTENARESDLRDPLPRPAATCAPRLRRWILHGAYRDCRFHCGAGNRPLLPGDRGR